MNMIKIRKFRKSDIKAICSLIRNTYIRFNKNEGTKKAIKNYINYHDPKINDNKKLIKRFNRPSIVYIATDNEKIVGVMRGLNNRINNLFIKAEYHKRGIGRELLKCFEKRAKKRNAKEIRIRSSLYATPFYQKMGYKKTTGIRNLKRLKIQPMKKIL